MHAIDVTPVATYGLSVETDGPYVGGDILFVPIANSSVAIDGDFDSSAFLKVLR